MTTKEIEIQDLNSGLMAIIIVSFICGLLGFWAFLTIFELQSQIDNSPKRVCHNESSIQEVSLGCGISNETIFYMPMPLEKCCINGEKTMNNGTMLGIIRNYCLVEYTKEVCEIK
jgi:hypothetical protein